MSRVPSLPSGRTTCVRRPAHRTGGRTGGVHAGRACRARFVLGRGVVRCSVRGHGAGVSAACHAAARPCMRPLAGRVRLRQARPARALCVRRAALSRARPRHAGPRWAGPGLGGEGARRGRVGAGAEARPRPPVLLAPVGQQHLRRLSGDEGALRARAAPRSAACARPGGAAGTGKRADLGRRGRRRGRGRGRRCGGVRLGAAASVRRRSVRLRVLALKVLAEALHLRARPRCSARPGRSVRARRGGRGAAGPPAAPA